MVLLLHFHTTKVQLFFHIRKKNNNYFSKKCTFLYIFLCGVKTPIFTRCTYAHTITKTTDPEDTIHTKQHPEHTITTCSTQPTPSTESQHPHTAHDGNTTHNTQQQPEHLNTLHTHNTHNTRKTQSNAMNT